MINCASCRADQCPAGTRAPCVLRAGHAPFSGDQMHLFDGLSPFSVWFPEHKVAEIMKDRARVAAESQATKTNPDLNVIIAIGNSDDKLTQLEWSEYCREVDALIRQALTQGLFTQEQGVWASETKSQFQNAAWSLTMPAGTDLTYFKMLLADIAHAYAQDSIAMTVGEVTFIKAKG